MKNILLATTALVAFAGAASAEISLSGTAKIGFNDTARAYADSGIDGSDDKGFYTDVDVDVKFSRELDNGWTAAAKYGFEFADGAGADSNSDFGAFDDNNLQLSLTSDFGGLYYGDYEFAAATYWSGVSDMDQDGFSEQDGETVIRAEAIFGDWKGGVSYAVVGSELAANATNVTNGYGAGDTAQLSLGVAGTVGDFSIAAAYQEETDFVGKGDFTQEEVFGLSVGTSFAGADVTVAYASTGDENSLGLGASYAVSDALTVSAHYVSESVADEDAYGIGLDYSTGALAVSFAYDVEEKDDHTFTLEGSYEVSDLLTVYAGHIETSTVGSHETYVAAEYDLGSSATLLASYGDVDADLYSTDSGDFDDVGDAYEVMDGLTLQLTLKF